MSTVSPNPGHNPNDPNRDRNEHNRDVDHTANEEYAGKDPRTAAEQEAAEPATTKRGSTWMWWLGLVALALLLIFGFRACSGGDAEQPTSPTADATATAAETPAAEQENPETATEGQTTPTN